MNGKVLSQPIQKLYQKSQISWHEMNPKGEEKINYSPKEPTNF